MDLADVIVAVSEGLEPEPLPSACLTFLHSHDVPEPIVARLRECALTAPVRVGLLRLSRLAELDRENTEAVNAPCIQHGFLIVGSGLNGDPIAIDLRTGTMAFVSHDALWEEDYQDFNEVVFSTPLSFDEFWVGAYLDPKFPRDSYDAADRWPSGRGPLP
jgi:hypothetical protein